MEVGNSVTVGITGIRFTSCESEAPLRDSGFWKCVVFGKDFLIV